MKFASTANVVMWQMTNEKTLRMCEESVIN
jgi:hypothetical protein